MKASKILFFITTSIILISCGSIKPEAPEIEIQKTPIPNQPVSSINIPIKVDLAPYFKETNKSVPKEFKGGEQNCEGVSYSYKFKREPIKFVGKGKYIKFDVDGKYWVKLNYCVECNSLLSSSGTCILPRIYASCGIDEPMRKMYVGFKSEIGITKDYKLKAKTTLSKVKASSPCKITLFNYNATATLEKEVTKAMKSVEKDIDKEIGAVDLREDMEATWNILREPIDLEGYGYMYMKPSRVSVGDIRYKGDTAYFDAYLKAYPKIYLDTIDYEGKPLPNMGNFEKNEGFDIHMDISAKYDSLSNVLTRNISGTKIDVKGKEVIFGDVVVHGAANHQLTIKIDFSGKKNGSLYLTGTPKFDAEKQHISFPDLEFDIKTRSALLKSAKWLFDKKITDLVRTSASMDLKPYLDDLKASLTTSLNGEIDKGVFMSGNVDDIIIDFIYPREHTLFIRIQSKGTLGIQM